MNLDARTQAGAAISIRDLEHDFGDAGFRLAIPSLEIAAGEHVAIIGPSGCGKSTLLNLIAGILVPRAGIVSIGGVALSQLSEPRRRGIRRREIGLVFQEFELLEYLKVRENVLLPYYLGGDLPLDDVVRTRGRALLERAGIATHAEKVPRALSQGERQRVAVCRALITLPAVVLADEPTGNLDPHNSKRVIELLRSECASRGATLLLVTHDHSLLTGFARVVDLGIPTLAGGSR